MKRLLCNEFEVKPSIVKMIRAIFVFAVLAVTYGDEISSLSRQGNLNTYFIYTLDAPLTAVPLASDIAFNESSPLSVNNSLTTVVLVHGHEGNGFSPVNALIKNELFSGGHIANVIVVDWSSYSQLSYSNAAAAVPSVGVSLGQLLERLENQNRISFENLHLVGFNLGAHVVGFAGRTLNGRVARITGLDPSKSQWGDNSPRLSKSDAIYVEVIHTDGTGLRSNGIGTAIGLVDFFVNGGGDQPGCFSNSCSHERAYELFAATLSRNEPLLGNRCRNDRELRLNICRSNQLAIGGNDLLKLGVEGIYRVNTGRSFPF